MRRFFAIIFAALILALSASPLSGQTQAAEQMLTQLIADMEKAALENDPIAAGEKGDRAARRRLGDVSPEASRSAGQKQDVFRARHSAIDRAGLTESSRLNYDLLGYVLSRDLLLAPVDEARIPFQSDSGFYSSLSYAVRTTRFDTAQDYEDYIARLNDVPRFFDQHIANMQRGIETGYVASAQVLPGVIEGIEALTSIAPEDHPYAAPFKTINARIDPETAARIKSSAAEAMTLSVMPAFQELLAFMQTQYLPRARAQVGVSSVPGGRDYYARMVKYYTTLDISPEQVHAIGQSEVARIRAEMEDVIKQTGFEGTFAEFLNFLRTDPQFYVTKRDDLLKEAAWISKRIDGKMPEFFGTLARLSYGVIPVPEELEKNYTTGRYFNGNAKEGKAGNYVVNTYNLSNRPLYNLPALTLHEGVPGHHHQISLASEQANVPAFRQDLYPHAFGEGWGLYAEKLGVEMGIYRTPYEHFGRLTYEMWRACRLVMDTGMHAMGWSREQAEACLYENSALAPHNIRTETDRYIAWPGQALAYKMGELKLIEIRKRAEEALGQDFDIRRFHDALLVEGAMPLSMLEDRMNRWIDAQKRPEKLQPMRRLTPEEAQALK